jgi:hypothetical protein
MTILSRVLSLSLSRRQSAFLWGARKTGKSTRNVGNIHIVPWRDFFAALWGGNVI